ncbi:MAG: hypothetical protein AAF721_19690 [Myxococcota bacterium]
MDNSLSRGGISAGPHRSATTAGRGLAACLCLAAVGGCATLQPTPSCPRGQSLSHGQCLPTPAVVFTRCVDSFRKTAVEHDRADQTKVAVRAQQYGEAQVQRGTQDHERAEYADVSDSLLADALVECRRQEEQQRAQEIERAWAAADAERQRADQATEVAEEAKRQQARSSADAEALEGKLASSVSTIEALEAALDDARAQRETERELLAEEHPCLAGAWARCGDQALASKRAGDHARAHELFAHACGGGDAKACANWGVMFEQGLGTRPDAFAAYAHYEEACALGSVEACASQGVLAMQGRGTDKDPDYAAKLLRAACKADVPRACGRLGHLLEIGATSARRSDTTVADLYGRACDHDDARSCLWLGDYLRRPRGAQRPQPIAAADAYARSCDGDEPEACLRLAELYAAGEGVPADRARAHALAQQACGAGLSLGCATAQRLAEAVDVAGIELD